MKALPNAPSYQRCRYESSRCVALTSHGCFRRRDCCLLIAVSDPFRPPSRDGNLRPRDNGAVDTRVTVWNCPQGDARAGGDWSDAFLTADHTVALTIGDVSGHGEQVAATMSVVRSAIMRALHGIKVPADVLSIANEVACERGVIVTAIVAVVDHQRRTLTFANAGHPPPLMCTKDDQTFLTHEQADLPLGVFHNELATNHVVALPPDALVVFYTDGITEHTRDPIAGARELVAASQRAHSRPGLSAARTIAREVLKSDRGDDDAAVIGLRSLSAHRYGLARTLLTVSDDSKDISPTATLIVPNAHST